MTLTPAQELENAIIKNNYYLVCDFLGLKENERLHLNAGAWIIDFLKQMQTANILAKSIRMRGNETQNIENYIKAPELPKIDTVNNT